LIFDIGFQLSFLSFLGLVYFSPFFSKVFENFPCFLAIRENLSATFGAQLMALPLLLYDFGRLSLISPLANIFVLPAIPFLTLSAFLFSSVGLISKPLGLLLSLPALALLKMIMRIIDFCSRLPLASVEAKISFLFLFVVYSGLALLIFRLRKKRLEPLLN